MIKIFTKYCPICNSKLTEWKFREASCQNKDHYYEFGWNSSYSYINERVEMHDMRLIANNYHKGLIIKNEGSYSLFYKQEKPVVLSKDLLGRILLLL